MSEDEFQVTSEIYLPSSIQNDSLSKPSLSTENVVTKFHFTLPLVVDEDGDLLVARRNDQQNEKHFIAIEHSPRSTLPLVGRQVWRGALLLADYIMHGGTQLLGGKTVMEVGSGVGLTSIVAAMFAKQVICTDIAKGGILELVQANANRNAHYLKADFKVLELDFFASSWSPELEAKLDEVTVILAADVIYDNDLTNGFISSLVKILSHPPAKTVYFALEKRYVFTMSDLDSVAPCYEYFLNRLQAAHSANPAVTFTALQVETDFPQYYQYDRVKQLVLWKIST